jgi:peptidoglycan LD-endopeptidase LytH
MTALKKKRSWLRKTLLILLAILIIGFLLPQTFKMPVQGATIKSYAQNSYWFYPWGKSVTHKGVDIFAKKGTPVHAATPGIVVFKGQIKRGGNVVLVLGPKWRLHYYAHLDSITTGTLSFVSTNTKIGTVGTTGNAAGKPPHLHYTIRTIIPFPWQIDKSHHGWKKMFYLNPISYLNEYFETTN